jgi:glycosyltransferase involved in cell wall biosynthesis
MRELSVVITVMNEEDNIHPLVDAIRKALDGIDYEVIFVDDGSVDTTRSKIKEVLDDRILLVELRKNYGQSTAMTAGIDYSTGKYVALLDGDLQNDPDDIPMMLDKLIAEDWDVVAGNRKDRQDGTFLRKIPSKIANAIIRSMTKVYIRDYGCTLKVFKREIAEDLGLYGELHRFIPVLAAMQGARIVQVDVKHHARRFGKSKYGLGRTFRVMSDLVTMVFFRKYSQKPMHLFGTMGFVLLFIGIIINLYLFVLKLMGEDIWGKPLLILGLITLLGGIQLITIGILAEVSIRTYYESSHKKTYQVRRVWTEEVEKQETRDKIQDTSDKIQETSDKVQDTSDKTQDARHKARETYKDKQLELPLQPKN